MKSFPECDALHILRDRFGTWHLVAYRKNDRDWNVLRPLDEVMSWRLA